MDIAVVEQILSCPSLPALPAVAAKVLEQSERSDTSAEDLAATLENDQGLASKVLKTANSSFYGVRRRCTTINGALVMLGLSTVRTLTLGFSLVSVMRCKADGFDAPAYWRRAVYSAVGARMLARRAGKGLEDEVFLGGLLQDIGVMAMYLGLGERYARIVAGAGADHRAVSGAEVAALGVGHADIGAMLAVRWRLPDELVVPIKYHERPTAAPSWCAHRVRCIAAGGLVHDVLTDAEPARAMELLSARAQEWLGVGAHDVKEVVENAARATREVSTLLAVETGPAPDARGALRKAGARARAAAAADLKPGAWDGRDLGSLLTDGETVDPITGVMRRRMFDTAVRSAFDAAQVERAGVSVLQVHIDGLTDLVRGRGVEAADEVLVASAALLRAHFDPIGGVVCRWDEDTFAVVVRGRTQGQILRAASEFREGIERASRRWRVGCDARPLAVTASIGAASVEGPCDCGARDQVLMAAAADAVRASRACGGNCVRAVVAGGA